MQPPADPHEMAVLALFPPLGGEILKKANHYTAPYVMTSGSRCAGSKSCSDTDHGQYRTDYSAVKLMDKGRTIVS